jgi:hypothetical protein
MMMMIIITIIIIIIADLNVVDIISTSKYFKAKGLSLSIIAVRNLPG